MDEEDGNGFDLQNSAVEEAFKGATYKIDGSHRPDGIITQMNKNQMGVMMKIATAHDNEKYRQLLLMGAFPTIDDARKCVAAIHERKMCGVPIEPILDRVTAECAVRGNGYESRVQELIRGLTSSYFHTNYMANQGKRHWWNKGREGNATANSNSPLNS